MRIVCWQTILMKYHTLFFRKLGKMSQNLSSAAVVIGALRVKSEISPYAQQRYLLPLYCDQACSWFSNNNWQKGKFGWIKWAKQQLLADLRSLVCV